MNGANGLFLVGSTPHPAADSPGAECDSGTHETCALDMDVFQHVALSFLCYEVFVFLAEPLWVRDGAVELVSGLIKLKLAYFRSLCCFCKKGRNSGRVQRLKTAGRMESLLKDGQRIAAGDDDTGGEIHGVVKALHGGGGLALENDVVTHRLHTQHADVVLEQDRQNFLFETIEVRVHYVERHLNSVEREPVL